MKALCIGKSSYIISSTVEKYPLEGSKNVLSEGYEDAGGCAAVIAYMLGKYKVDSYIGSVVGDDTYGNFIKKNLEQIGVHTEFMETAYNKKTFLNFVINAKESKSRSVYSIEKEPLLLKKNEFQLEPDIVITDGYDYGASLAALNKYNSKITLIMANCYTKEILELCKYCTYIVFSKEVAEKVSGQLIDYDNPQSLVSVYTSLVNKFIGKQIIVTLENRGCLYMKNGQINVMPGLNSEVVDLTAVGDIFKGAYAYGLLKGYDIEKAVTFANIASGLSITKAGSINSIPELSDINVYFHQKYAPEEKTEMTMQKEVNMISNEQQNIQTDDNNQ